MTSFAAQSNRLGLQPLNVEDHVDVLFELSSDPRVMRWSTKASHTSIHDTVTLINASQPTQEMPWMKKYAIMLLQRDISGGLEAASKPKMIGIIGTPREAEIGYKLSADYWGRGYMSEALALFVEMWWSHEENKIYTHLKALADRENVGSQRVLEKCGFKKGPLMKNLYCLFVNAESGMRSDLQMFYLERPGTGPIDVNSLKVPGPMHDLITKEDAASIRNVLANDGVERVNKAL